MQSKIIRPIRSFVRREGRMTDPQKLALERRWSDYGIALPNQGEKLDFAEIFGRSQKTVLEIGFGMGASLLEMAEQHPETNYLGIEVHRPGVGKLLSGIEALSLSNLRVICDDAVMVLKDHIDDQSLDGIQIYFPDPWPKKRHHKRRLIKPDFVKLCSEKIKLGAYIHCATDWENYAQQMMTVLSEQPLLVNQAGDDEYSPRPSWRPLTKFEARGQRLGHGIWDLIYTRVPS